MHLSARAIDETRRFAARGRRAIAGRQAVRILKPEVKEAIAMKLIGKVLAWLAAAFVILIVGQNVWGRLTLGSHSPADDAQRDPAANRVVMVFGATGSAGDGL